MDEILAQICEQELLFSTAAAGRKKRLDFLETKVFDVEAILQRHGEVFAPIHWKITESLVRFFRQTTVGQEEALAEKLLSFFELHQQAYGLDDEAAEAFWQQAEADF